MTASASSDRAVHTACHCAWLLFLCILCGSCASPAGSSVQPTPTGTPLLDDALRRDAETMAKQLGISPEEALRRAANQDAIGRLNAQLEQQEAETFAGLWIQNQPEYRVVVAFTRDGEKTIQRYVANTSLAGLIEGRTAQLSLAELNAVQQQLIRLIDELAWPFASSTNIQMNQVELYVTDRALMEADLRKTGRQLPEHVAVVVTYQPLGEPPPFPITPIPGITMPRLRARSATFMMALAVGPLREQDGCLRIGNDLIIWQPDYFLNDNHGRVEILNREGKVVARVGEKTRLSGGEVPLNADLEQQLREPIPSACHGPYWLMGEIETSP